MTGDWRTLGLAALAAMAVALACPMRAHAQAQPKQDTPAKNPKAKQSDGGKTKKAAAAKKQDPADAQEAIEAALKFLEEGKAEQAEEGLTTLLKGGKLPPAIMARALLYRGIAYRQQKKPAQAIADLTSALWVKGGLAEADRKDALRQRTSAYQEAGLSDAGDAVAPAVPGGARSATRTASASGLSDDGQSGGQAAAKQGGGWSLTNPFSGWFGNSSASTEPPPQQAAPPAATASIEPASSRGPASSGWSNSTQVRDRGSDGVVTSAAPEKRVAAAARSDGKFRVQVGMVRTEAEAEALASRIKRDHAAVLATRETEIDQTVVGNMGSFYRVRIGPYANAGEGQAACAKLRGPGIDCLVVTQ
jgi:hypothetical protein